MAADLHIHIKTDDITEKDLEIFFSSNLGSKYCHFPAFKRYEKKEETKAWKVIEKSPNIWIGEVSWLKAGLLNAKKEFVPSTVQKISEIIGEDLPILNKQLIEKIFDAFLLNNKTQYKLASVRKVVTFLQKYIGKPVFTVSW